MYCWSLIWRTLSTALLACWMSAIVWSFKNSLALPFFGIGIKTDLFQSCGLCWVFQIFWHIECSTFTASSFRTWNSSAGTPSPPLALFVVMLHYEQMHLKDSTVFKFTMNISLTASSFRTCNSSAGILSPSLALIIVMLERGRDRKPVVVETLLPVFFL